MNSMKIVAARLVLLRPRLRMRHPIQISGAAGANPLFRKPRLLIAEQRNRPRGALMVRQTQAFVRDRAPLDRSGTRDTRFSRLIERLIPQLAAYNAE